MNLQTLRDELTARAASADDRPTDLLPGVRTKIRRTRRRRTAAALGTVAAIAALAFAVVPSVLTSTPDPADPPPADYTKDGMTVPGIVGSDRLLKPWIGAPKQDKVSFSWTPSTTSITIRATCISTGALKGVRIRVGDWYVGDVGCLPVQGWQLSTRQLPADDPLWLDSPVGKPVEVTAEVVDLQTRRPGDPGAQIAVGIYSSSDPGPAPGGIPSRAVPAGPDDHVQNGVTYRRKVGGESLTGAAVGEPGHSEVRFSLTPTGAPLTLRTFCTANVGSESPERPYLVSIQIGTNRSYQTTCEANSTDAGTGTGLTVTDVPPADGPVQAVARIVPVHSSGAAVPPTARLGLGIYFHEGQRTLSGVSLDERIEVEGYDYQLADTKIASGPDGRVSIDTPVGQPYVIAYGSSPLGTSGRVEGTLTVGRAQTTLAAAPGTGGSLGIGREPKPAGPADRATLTLTQGKATKGTLIVAIYLPA
jgi:hypothetical protein